MLETRPSAPPFSPLLSTPPMSPVSPGWTTTSSLDMDFSLLDFLGQP
jgi:hypothetical protein